MGWAGSWDGVKPMGMRRSGESEQGDTPTTVCAMDNDHELFLLFLFFLLFEHIKLRLLGVALQRIHRLGPQLRDGKTSGIPSMPGAWKTRGPAARPRLGRKVESIEVLPSLSILLPVAQPTPYHLGPSVAGIGRIPTEELPCRPLCRHDNFHGDG